MKKISGVLFDFNGTLFFDSKMHIEAFREVHKLYSLKPPTEDYMIKNIFGRTNERIFKENFKADATPLECELFNMRKKQLYFDVCLSHPERMKLAPGATDMLDYLKENNIPYALATGSDREEVEFFMEHLGLGRWFSFDKNIVYTDGTFRGKPEPDCYILAAEKISLTAPECVVFEDGKSGITAASAAGCGAIIAIHEREIPSPVSQDIHVDGEFYSFETWRNIVSDLGL